MFGRTNGNNGRTNGRNGSVNGRNGRANGRNGHRAARRNNRITSLIGPDIAYEGTLTGEGGIRIDGTFNGRINIKGPLVVTETGKVIAEEIRASVASVAGSVRGDIIAHQVEILAGGRVWGDVTTTAFAAEDGAYLRGQVKMLDEVAEVAAVA